MPSKNEERANKIIQAYTEGVDTRDVPDVLDAIDITELVIDHLESALSGLKHDLKRAESPES